MSKPCLIIGAGISGLTLAERFANVLGKEVVIIEKRPYIGGNCYDYLDEKGILVPKHGPHLFHTNSEKAWDYIKQFSEWNFYEHRVKAFVDKKFVSLPINIDTVNFLLNLNLKDSNDMLSWANSVTKEFIKKYTNPKNSEEVGLTRFGKAIYEKLFLNYTKKQWGISPKFLSPEILSRIPIRYNFDDRYFTDKYQFMPSRGFYYLFNQMVKNSKIQVKLNSDALNENFSFDDFEIVIFTGPIDSFFKFSKGKLSYRSMRFEHETLNQEFFQPCAVVNYPNEELFTRITEPKHSTFQKSEYTTIIKEYPSDIGEPMYPVLDAENTSLYNEYLKEAKKLESKNIFFVGRLAEFKYLNMDAAINNALDFFENIKKSL